MAEPTNKLSSDTADISSVNSLQSPNVETVGLAPDAKPVDLTTEPTVDTQVSSVVSPSVETPDVSSKDIKSIEDTELEDTLAYIDQLDRAYSAAEKEYATSGGDFGLIVSEKMALEMKPNELSKEVPEFDGPEWHGPPEEPGMLKTAATHAVGFAGYTVDRVGNGVTYVKEALASAFPRVAKVHDVVGRGVLGAGSEVADTLIRIADAVETEALGTDILPEGLSNTTKLMIRTGGGYFPEPKTAGESLAVNLVQFATGFAAVSGVIKKVQTTSKAIQAIGFLKNSQAGLRLAKLAEAYPKMAAIVGIAAEAAPGDIAGTIAMPNSSFGQLIEEITGGTAFGGYTEWYNSKSYLGKKLIGGLEGSVLSLGVASSIARAKFLTGATDEYIGAVKDAYFGSVHEGINGLAKSAADLGDTQAEARLRAAAAGDPTEIAKLEDSVNNLFSEAREATKRAAVGPDGIPIDPVVVADDIAEESVRLSSVGPDGIPIDPVKTSVEESERSFWSPRAKSAKVKLQENAKKTAEEAKEAAAGAKRLQNEAIAEANRLKVAKQRELEAITKEAESIATSRIKLESDITEVDTKVTTQSAKAAELKTKLDEAAKISTEVESKVNTTTTQLDDLRIAETELRVKIREARAEATDVKGEGAIARKNEIKQQYRQLELDRDRTLVEIKKLTKELRKVRTEGKASKAVVDNAEAAYKEAQTQVDELVKAKEATSKAIKDLDTRKATLDSKLKGTTEAPQTTPQPPNEIADIVTQLQDDISKSVDQPPVQTLETPNVATEVTIPEAKSVTEGITPVKPLETAGMPTESPAMVKPVEPVQMETKATDLGEPHTFTVVNKEGKEVTVITSDQRAEAILSHYKNSIRGKGTVVTGAMPTETTAALRDRLGLKSRDAMASYAKKLWAEINGKSAKVVDERLLSDVPDITLPRGFRGSRSGAIPSGLEDVAEVIYKATSKVWHNPAFRKSITNKGLMGLLGFNTRVAQYWLSDDGEFSVVEALGYAAIGGISASLARRFMMPAAEGTISAFQRSALLKEIDKAGQSAVDTFKNTVKNFRSSSITGETRLRTAEYLSDLGQSLLELPKSLSAAKRFVEANPDILSLTSGSTKITPDAIVSSLKGTGSKAKVSVGIFDLTSVESVAASIKSLSGKIESGLTPAVIKDIFPSDKIVDPFIELLESAGVQKSTLDDFKSGLRLNDPKALSDMHAITLIGNAIDEELDGFIKKSVELSRTSGVELSDRELLGFHSAVAKHKLFYSVLANKENAITVAQTVAQKTAVLRSLPDDVFGKAKIVVDEIKDGTKAIIRRLVDNSESEGIRKLTKAERNTFIGALGDNVTMSEALCDFMYQSLLSGITTPIKAIGTNTVSAGTATANNIMEGFFAGDLGRPMKFAQGVVEALPQAFDNTLEALITGKSVVDPSRTKAYIRSVDKAIIAAETGFNQGSALDSMLSVMMNNWVKDFGPTRPTHWALAADEFTKTLLNAGLMKKNLHVAAMETAKGDPSIYKAVITGIMSGDSNFSAIKSNAAVASLKEASKYTFTEPLRGKGAWIEKMWRDNPMLSIAEPIFVTSVRAAAEAPRYIGADIITDPGVRKALVEVVTTGKMNDTSAKFLGRLSTGAVGLYTVNRIIHSDPDIEFSGSMLWDVYSGSAKKARGMKPWHMRWGDIVYDISDTPWSKLIGTMVDYQQMGKYIEVNESALSNEEKSSWRELQAKYVYGMAAILGANLTPDSLRSLAEKATGYQHRGKGATYKEISKTALKEIPNEVLSRFIPVGLQQALSAQDGIAMAYTNDFSEKLGFLWSRLKGESENIPRATDFYGDPKSPNKIAPLGAKKVYKDDTLMTKMEDIGFNTSEFNYRRSNIGGVALSASQKESFMKLTGSKIKKRRDMWLKQMDRMKSKSDQRKFLQSSLNDIYAESVFQFLSKNKKLQKQVDLKSVDKDVKSLYDSMED